MSFYIQALFFTSFHFEGKCFLSIKYHVYVQLNYGFYLECRNVSMYQGLQKHLYNFISVFYKVFYWYIC